jgi:ATP/maltotriose-dependent transcriptional regulator MalT
VSSAEDTNRHTWNVLDQPTIGYVMEVMREVLGDEPWARMQVKFAQLDAKYGKKPLADKLRAAKIDAAFWKRAVNLESCAERELAVLKIICDGYQGIADDLEKRIKEP